MVSLRIQDRFLRPASPAHSAKPSKPASQASQPFRVIFIFRGFSECLYKHILQTICVFFQSVALAQVPGAPRGIGLCDRCSDRVAIGLCLAQGRVSNQVNLVSQIFRQLVGRVRNPSSGAAADFAWRVEISKNIYVNASCAQGTQGIEKTLMVLCQLCPKGPKSQI